VARLPLTDEAIRQKVAELVDKELARMLPANLKERMEAHAQLSALQGELNALDADLDKLNEKLDLHLTFGKKLKEMEHRLAMLTRDPPKSFAEAMERSARR
jgi:hypothetical protein